MDYFVLFFFRFSGEKNSNSTLIEVNLWWNGEKCGNSGLALRKIHLRKWMKLFLLKCLVHSLPVINVKIKMISEWTWNERRWHSVVSSHFSLHTITQYPNVSMWMCWRKTHNSFAKVCSVMLGNDCFNDWNSFCLTFRNLRILCMQYALCYEDCLAFCFYFRSVDLIYFIKLHAL